MNRIRSNSAALALVASIAMLAVGCAPAAEPSPTPTAVAEAPTETPEPPRVYPANADYFFVSGEGAVGKFAFPGESNASIEELRNIVGAAPVTYVTVVVDNRQGAAPVNMYELAAFDPDGRKYTFSTVDTFMDDWMTTIGTDTNEEIELYNRFVDAVNANMIYAEVGMVATFVMASADVDLPAEFSRITVQASGGMTPGVEVMPVSEAEDAGVDLSFEAP